MRKGYAKQNLEREQRSSGREWKEKEDECPIIPLRTGIVDHADGKCVEMMKCGKGKKKEENKKKWLAPATWLRGEGVAHSKTQENREK